MELDRRALDRYLTREPDWYDYEPPVYKCSECGRFLKQEPDGKREAVAVRHCDGKPHVIECEHDESVLQIIGEEHRGEKFKVAYTAACGGMEASSHLTYDGEISPDQVEAYTHDPHWFVDDVWGYQIFEIRTCVCGHYNEEPVA
jgi:hypothetical protein